MIYLASDHRGFDAKEQLKVFLKSLNFDFEDLGPFEYNADDDYPDYAFKLGETVVKNSAKGIIICGSGVGVNIAANKVHGVRAGYSESVENAVKSRTDDNTNILVLDSMTFNPDTDFPIVRTWLTTEFSNEERHARRLKKIADYESAKR